MSHKAVTNVTILSVTTHATQPLPQNHVALSYHATSSQVMSRACNKTGHTI